MPKQVQKAEVNSFLGGLITESSVLNFPPNAASDLVNFELNRDGRLNRRLGMDFEPGFSYQSTSYSSANIDSLGYFAFKWETVGGNPTLNFMVFQIGNYLYFYNADVINFTENGAITAVQLTEFDPSVNFSMDSVEGKLAVVSGAETIAVVEYTNPNFSVNYQRILTRDLWGIEETTYPLAETDPSYRPGDSQDHRYNLYNQSWGIPRKDDLGALVNPIDFFKSHNHLQNPPIDENVTPSNSEAVWTGLQYQSVALSTVSSQQPFERMYRNLWDDSLGVKTYNATGYFIIDAMRRGQGRQDAINSNLVKYPAQQFSGTFRQDFTPGGPSCVAEYAGRFWFGGFQGNVIDGDKRSPNLSNYLFFSQLVKNTNDIVKCYQEGDPTSRDSSDVVDTDGGFVRVSGAQNIIALRQLGNGMIVFASNGVWMVTGGTIDSGFTATNYKITKISTFGIISINSLIVEGDSAFFWATDGIYQVGRNSMGDYAVASITLKSIQQFYQSIPSISRSKSFGAYDEVNKKLRWVYQIGNSFTADQDMHELILDTTLSAFSHNVLENATNNIVVIKSIFPTRVSGTQFVNTQVVVSGDTVNASSVPVVISSDQKISTTQYVRYMSVVSINGALFLTVSYYCNTNWTDWGNSGLGGTDAKAYLLTGSITGGDSSVNKQVPYLTLHFVQTESGMDTNGIPLNQSSCFYRSQWGFTDSISSGRWSTLSQGYRFRKLNEFTTNSPFDNGYQVMSTRNKVRGSGRAFAIYLESEANKDLQILGWSISMTVNQLA